MMKELHLQTERERQLELHLVGTVRQIHSLTVKSIKNQKKLEEESREATKKLEHCQDQRRVREQCTEEVLRNAEKAKQQLLELQQLREIEQATMDEYRAACERLVLRELAGDIVEGRGTAMKSQEISSVEVEKLSVDSRDRIGEYTMINEYRTPIKRLHDEKQRLLDREVRSAIIRQEKLDDELNKSDSRREKLERDSCQLGKEMEIFDREFRESVDRERQLQLLIKDKKTKSEKAKQEVNGAQWAVQNELDLAKNQEKLLLHEVNMSSERSSKFHQEIWQVDKRQCWLDQMKSTCNDEGSARELLQQTSLENDVLKERLQQLVKSEQDLSKGLLQAQENMTVSKRGLEIASESLNNLLGMTDQDWKGSKQTAQTCLILEKESNLQELLNEARDRQQRVEEETDLTLSKETELHMKLLKVSENERIFKIPIRQLKYSESGKCS